MSLTDEIIKELKHGPPMRGDHVLSRTTFLALAYYCGWDYARIGRHLGITRQAVSQRIDDLKAATLTHNMPLLTELMTAPVAPPHPQFAKREWMSPGFRNAMLTYIEVEAERRRVA